MFKIMLVSVFRAFMDDTTDWTEHFKSDSEGSALDAPPALTSPQPKG